MNSDTHNEQRTVGDGGGGGGGRSRRKKDETTNEWFGIIANTPVNKLLSP